MYKPHFVYSSISHDASTFWQLWQLLLWALVYLLRSLFLLPFSINSEVGFLDHVLILSLLFWRTSIMFSSRPLLCKGSSFSASLTTLVIFWHFPSSCPHGREVVAYCGFHWHFPDSWCWTSFHVLVGHLYLFFGEMSVQVIGPFFFKNLFFLVCCVACRILFPHPVIEPGALDSESTIRPDHWTTREFPGWFVLLSFKSFLCILDNNSLSDMSPLNVFYCLWPVFILLTVSFTDRNF